MRIDLTKDQQEKMTPLCHEVEMLRSAGEQGILLATIDTTRGQMTVRVIQESHANQIMEVISEGSPWATM
jgi:hypothetical protein